MRIANRAYGAALPLVYLIAACSPANEAPPVTNEITAAAPAASPSAPAADVRLVVALGDSLYAGYNLAPGEGFAPVLERALKAQGVAAQVVNAGVSGDTSAAGRQRLGFVLDGLPRKPDLVLVGLGANDMLRGLSPDATRENIEAICAELQKRGIPIMLTGMLASPNMGPAYAAAFNPIYPDLAKEYDAPLDPFFLDGVITNRSLLLDDGIHPNPQGVTKIVARIGPVVAGALQARK